MAQRIVIRGLALCALLSHAWAQNLAADKASASDIEFFEAKIRPVLVKSCYPCHSNTAKSVPAGLYLDSRNGIRKGGSSGPAVVPGKPEESVLIHALRYENRKMPPIAKLPNAVIADFDKWIAMGAPDPRDGLSADWKPSTIDIEKGRKFWAFQPVRKAPVPAVKDKRWSSQPIDRFLRSRMEDHGLTPVSDAGRATWLRRVTFDLTGLPPDVDEIDAFARDRSPDAYAKVVDRLLASPRYGERWGRHWLDVARYAESVGPTRNYVYPYAWRYRNYVIESFNRDKPYDRFIAEQIAGDLLPAHSDEQRAEQITGTGFLAVGAHDLLEVDADLFRMDYIAEQIDATTRAFLGLTVGCARCHDHKFDPIPTTDYYAMAGIFASTETLSGLHWRPKNTVTYFDTALLARVSDGPGETEPAHLKDPQKIRLWEKLQAQFLEILKHQPPTRPVGKVWQDSALNVLGEMDQFPIPSDLVMGARDHAESSECDVNVHGDPHQLGPKIPRGFVQVLTQPGGKAEIGSNGSGRLELARWIARSDNPLTARVAVNRIWQNLFGRGLVATVDNLGAMGERPSHPELLDYLAARFTEQGWSVKKMIREIALSRAYRLSSAQRSEDATIDPDDVFLWRMRRRRLEVEAIRDSLLAVAGELDLSPPAESPVLRFRRSFDIGRERGTMPEDYAVKLRWRSVYLPVLRNFLPPMFEVFDFPEPSESKGRRDVTTVPTQALFLINSPFVMEQSRRAAERLVVAGGLGDAERVVRAYRQTLGREPSVEEQKRSLEFVKAWGRGGEDAGAWSRLYQALFVSAEFRYRS